MRSHPEKSYHSSGKAVLLYFSASSGFGGAETFLLQAARLHDRSRFEPVFCLLREGPLADRLRQLGVQTRVAGFDVRLSRPWSAARAVRWIADQAGQTGAALIHSGMAYGALLGAPAALRARVPHVWFQHGPVSGWMDRAAMLLPSSVVYVNSEFTLLRQRRILGPLAGLVTRSKAMETLRLGVEELDRRLPSREAVADLRSEWGLSVDDLVFGVVCRPQPQKGLEQFVRAMTRARVNSGRRELKGVIVGVRSASGGDAYESGIRKLAAREDSGVTLVPPASDVLPALDALDVLVCSSISPEAYGLTLVEAMARAKATIAPREGGPLEIITEGENGLFFAPRSVEDLSRVIARLAEDPALRARLGRDARAHALEHLDARKAIAALERSYDRILSTSSRAITSQESRFS